jgi:hypothetical protein
MVRARFRSLLTAALLLLPLAVVAGWLAHGILHPSPRPEAAAPAAPRPAPLMPPALQGFPDPSADLPADRLHERVDGAEDYLRGQGCARLLAWDLEDPKGTLEVLLFSTPEGASRVLAHDAGPKRTAGPGDEASSDAQSVLFRRGRAYVRVIADPDAASDPARLLAEAARADRAILDGMGRGL